MSERKIFVLDTSVILHDPQVLRSFEEHDIAIPLTVLEELDRFKKGNSVLNRNAREFIRMLDEYSGDNLLREWIPLNGPESGAVRVIKVDQEDHQALIRSLSSSTNDNSILGAALDLKQKQRDRLVILVSKDINLRLKAKALELQAEDYKHIQIRDIRRLYLGKSELTLTPDQLDRLHSENLVPLEEIESFTDEPPPYNHFFIVTGGQKSGLAWYNPRVEGLERITKKSAYGILPRNAEQTFAMRALLDNDIPLVTLTGPAGTGKTLIALATCLEKSRDYRRIYLARPIVPLSNKDLGYLPGDVQSKINPYMQPLWDNLSFIKSQFDPGSPAHQRVDRMVETGKLSIIPLAYIRGRSIAHTLFIVDEAQNLTPHEVKTIITRAGDGAKIIMTGDIHQIDTPYLDAQTNGLSYLIDRLKGHPLYAHVTLEKGERSELANLASEML